MAWRTLGLRARILLVCGFRLGMGKEALLSPAVCCVIFQSLEYSPSEPWDLGFLESICILLWPGCPTLNLCWVAILLCSCCTGEGAYLEWGSWATEVHA